MKTHIDTVVCDDGHYGFSCCGNCSYTVDITDEKCPKCGAEFTEAIVSPGFGGSDF